MRPVLGFDGAQRRRRGLLPAQLTATEPLLRFRPRPMVRWLSPAQLLRTGLRAAFAGIITAFVDAREMQAALPRLRPRPRPGVPGPDDAETGDGARPFDLDLSARKEVWIDYVADTGDGFAPTYAVASLIARESLQLKGLPLVDGRPGSLRAAHLLVMGGDEVYPSASREDYTDRLIAPFTAARPPAPEDAGAYLLALPGNHDWYDGLTSFLRVFCEAAPVGRWRTVQSRSYFGVRLPHHWQLWGADIQLAARIDAPQLDFFDQLAHAGDDGDRLILCLPQPGWLSGTEEPAYRNTRFLERRIPGNLRLALALSGDVHHYSRYLDRSGETQRITTGAGGAYCRGSGCLPRVIACPEGEDERDLVETGHPFPDRSESRRLARRTLRLPFLAETRGFCAFLTSLYLAAALSLGIGRALRELPLAPVPPRDLRAFSLDWHLLYEILHESGLLLLRSPLATIVLILALGGTIGFAALFNDRPSERGPALWGALHGALHAALTLAIFWGAGALAHALGDVPLPRWLTPGAQRWFVDWWVVAYVAMVPLAWLLGGALFGAYLVASERWLGLHDNEVFSAQAIPDYRSFLRMHLDGEGGLTIYAIGVRHVPRRWRVRRAWRPQQPLFEPVDDEEPVAHLIEGPIYIPPRRAAEPAPAHRQEPAIAGG